MFFGNIFRGIDEFGLVAAGNGNCFSRNYHFRRRIIHWFVGV
jgi:hypothetical protein